VNDEQFCSDILRVFQPRTILLFVEEKCKFSESSVNVVQLVRFQLSNKNFEFSPEKCSQICHNLKMQLTLIGRSARLMRSHFPFQLKAAGHFEIPTIKLSAKRHKLREGLGGKSIH
jgi:hypothetical protein